MELSELTVNGFCDVLASSAPAPGGGSASALAGALGAALTSMVCALTAGKETYAEFWDLAADTDRKAAEDRIRFLDVMQRDTEAFRKIGDALSMPKATDEEKAARSAALQNALTRCTETPMEMMELAADALVLTEAVLGKTNKNAVSDLGVSALLLAAAMKGAWLNVLINIGSLKDKEAAGAYRRKGEALLARSLERADRIYASVCEAL